MESDIKDPARIEKSSSQNEEARSLHDAFAADTGMFAPHEVKHASAASVDQANQKDADAVKKSDSKDATSKENEAVAEDDDEFVRETLKFPDEHKDKLQSLIEAEKIMPMLSPVMENQMDDLISDADQAGQEVRDRLNDDLEHFDGQSKLDRADKALAGFRTAFYEVGDKSHKEAIYKYLTSNSVVMPGELVLYPKLKDAIDELGKSQSDPDYAKAMEIRTEAHNKLEALAVLKEDYAKHLAATERSGKALVMIVQAKEIRTEINRRN